MLHRPLQAGDPIVYWQLGDTVEQRFDVPDQPMEGEMDPFFFLTKHKNFIPHEYPCRTVFGRERRARRPTETGVMHPSRNWLPFGSHRVDLSGFWFRPTQLGTWASAVLVAEKTGKATLRLGTCGGAILFVNDAEAGWMADYVRNLEARKEFEVELNAGENEIRIWFDDLAERDARYFFQLDYVRGPAVRQALPTSCEPAVASAVEAMLDDMHFEQPTYKSGEVALVTGAPLPVAADVSIGIAGDFMSTESTGRQLQLKEGQARLLIDGSENLPADFRHFEVEVSVGGFSALRVFGVEICHAARQGQAGATLAQRIEQALDEVSEHAEADAVRAFARLASGRGGAVTDAMLARVLPAIEDCHDCADFILVPLLWCRQAYGASIAPDVTDRIDRTILGFRYWMDEPGNDVQWYFSENHALLFHTAAYIAGALLPDAKFERSGRFGKEQSRVGLERVRAWLDHFEKWEMAEFNSATYFPIDLKGLTALYGLSPDEDVRERAGKAIARLIEIVARSAHHGILTGAQGRSYEHTLRASSSLELSGIARMLWGKGNFGCRFHALPQLAICVRDHALEVPDWLAAVANYQRDEAQEWCFAQGQDRIARLYHYKTRDFAVGTIARYRWGEWGYQETVFHARMGDNPDTQFWINHPGETIHSGYGRPSYWGGSGTLPRLHQYRGLAVLVFDCAPEQPDFTHAWTPYAAFDEMSVDGDIVTLKGGNALALLKGSGSFDRVSAGPTAGNEIRLAGRKSAWIVRLSDTARSESREVMARKFAGLSIARRPDGTILVEDAEYGNVLFRTDGRVEAEGRVIDPSHWSIEGSVTNIAAQAGISARPTGE